MGCSPQQDPARQLWKARHLGHTIDAVRSDLSKTKAEAYAIQETIAALSGMLRCGYKVGSISVVGADPNTDWLEGSGVALDPKGFVLTGSGTGGTSRPLETSERGVFAIGDVRSGSTKRLATAVGEGAQVVARLHTFLAEEKRPDVVLKSGSG